MYTIMSTEEAANGKSYWAELEISGKGRSLSTSLWTLTHLTALHIGNNSLSYAVRHCQTSTPGVPGPAIQQDQEPSLAT